ncbi:hypothetical protein HOE425_310148 [Hoeflea sp. EC-HK425]|nr:hypothetical protein HOE425_310148 [Hoeflea sp. EC-HK425]
MLAGGRSAIVSGLPSGPMTYLTRGRTISVIGLSYTLKTYRAETTGGDLKIG